MVDNVRNEFVRDVCDAIRQYTLFPTKIEREHVAVKIVDGYPFLKDAIGSGIGSLEQSMAFRFKNMRRNRPNSQTGSLKTTCDNDDATTKQKRLKLATTAGVLPLIPEGETDETFNDHCKRIGKEMGKTKGKNLQLIKDIMNCSFAMRRREIIGETKPVREILKKFPALALPFELKRDFSKITGFKCADALAILKSLSPKIVEYGSQFPAMKKLVCTMSSNIAEEDNSTAKCNKDIQETAALVLLPLILKDKKENLFLKVVDENESIDKVISETTTPRIVGIGDQCDPIYIAIESHIIGGPLKLHSILDAPIVLMSAYYTFNIQYPLFCNVYPFLEAVLFDNKQIIKNKVVVHKVITSLLSK